APSANLSGRPSPTTAAHVKNDLDGRVAAIVDGGETGIGVESTVVDCSGDDIKILRPGGITRSGMKEVVGVMIADPVSLYKNNVPKSPGMKYRHYAPAAKLYLVDGSMSWLQSLVDERRDRGVRVGVLTTDERKHDYQADAVLSCG